jgi:hypothetical protein
MNPSVGHEYARNYTRLAGLPGVKLPRYCGARSDKAYRFSPAIIGDGDMARVHGTGERLAIESFALGVRYFYQLIKNSDKL